MVLVIPAIATPLHRTQLRELLLPITEHMRFDTAQITNLTNSEVAFRGNGRERFLQLNQCGREETSKSTPSLKQAQLLTGTLERVLFCHNHDNSLRSVRWFSKTSVQVHRWLNQPSYCPEYGLSACDLHEMLQPAVPR